jgi:ABC-2 type transport system permease protein
VARPPVNAVFILWLRQLKRYFRSRARMIGSLGQPILFLLALGFGLGPTFARAGGGDYVQFLAPGIVTMGILFTAVFSGIEIIWDRQFGFLKETLVAPVSRFEIVLGRTLGSATVALIQGSIVFLVCLAAGFFERGDFSATIEVLAPLAAENERIGGSRAPARPDRIHVVEGVP